MHSSLPDSTPLRVRWFGLVVALLAVAVQLGYAARLPAMAAPTALEQGVICHSEGGPALPRLPDSDRDCGLCPVCLALARPATSLLSPSPPSLPLPRLLGKWQPHVVNVPVSLQLGRFQRPRSRAPPRPT